MSEGLKLIKKRLSILLNGTSKVSYDVIQPLVNRRKRKLIEVGIGIFSIVIIILLSHILVELKIDAEDGLGRVILWFTIIPLFYFLNKLSVRLINKTRKIGDIVLEKEELKISFLDMMIPYSDIMKVWYSYNLLDNYLSKHPKPKSVLVKILTASEQKIYLEIEVLPNYRGVKNETKNIPDIIGFFEDVMPRYGLHENKKLRKIEFYNEVIK